MCRIELNIKLRLSLCMCELGLLIILYMTLKYYIIMVGLAESV